MQMDVLGKGDQQCDAEAGRRCGYEDCMFTCFVDEELDMVMKRR